MGCRVMVRDRGDGSRMTERGRNRDERRQQTKRQEAGKGDEETLKDRE